MGDGPFSNEKQPQMEGAEMFSATRFPYVFGLFSRVSGRTLLEEGIQGFHMVLCVVR